MRSIRISHTIYLLLGAALFAGGAASTYLMYRCASVSDRYTAVVQGEIAQAQQVRVLQVNFKKQVQAWKDILLRGKDDAALQKYDTEFHTLAAQVHSGSAALAAQIRDAQASAALTEFGRQHEQLNGQYESALAAYRLSRDFAEADAAVKGKDRPPPTPSMRSSPASPISPPPSPPRWPPKPAASRKYWRSSSLPSGSPSAPGASSSPARSASASTAASVLSAFSPRAISPVPLPSPAMAMNWESSSPPCSICATSYAPWSAKSRQ